MTDGAAAGQLDGRITVVTGASRGLGAAVARRFGAEGAQLVLVARTAGGLEEVDDEIRAAGGRPATLVPLDLRDFDALDRLGASLYERHGRVDVLVGNAGVLGTLSPLGHVEPATWAEVVEVNLTANWRLIRSFDPLLRRSEAGRAIFVTAPAAAEHRPYWGPYAATKSALESLVKTYAAEMAQTRVRANLIDPGVIGTALRAQAFPGEDPASLASPDSLADDVLALARPDCALNGETIGRNRTRDP